MQIQAIKDINDFFCIFSYCLVLCLTKQNPTPKKTLKQQGSLLGQQAFLPIYAQDHYLIEGCRGVGRLKFLFCTVLYDLHFYLTPVGTLKYSLYKSSVTFYVFRDPFDF